MTDGTVGAVLARVLRVAGVGAVFGDELGGVPVVATPSAASGALLAAVHARIHGGLAASVQDRLLTVTDGSSAPPSPSPVRVDSPAALAALPPALAHAQAAGMAVVVQLDLDLAASVGADVELAAPDVVDRWVEPDADAIDALTASRSPIVLAGPGVVRAGAVPGLHALAAAGRLGVLNTWGAKGVFDWRSRHHLATAGLQAEDFALGGLAEADLIVAVGVEAGEAPADRWRPLAPILEISPGEMDPLSQIWSRPDAAWPEVPALRTRLAGVTQAGWADESTPLPPTRVTRGYGAVLGDGGLVAADAGLAGYWVARTFATTRLGGAQVPAEVVPGFAVAAALVARLRQPSRPVLAVLDAPPEGAAVEILDLADRLGLGIGVEVWSADGDRLDADAHVARLRRLATVERSEVVSLATSPDQLPQMVEAAGPIVAWPALDVG